MDEQYVAIDIRGIFRRRKWLFVLCALPVFAVGAAVAFMLPPVYRSEATILVEGQQIPQEFVRATITGFVEERLQSLKQQIMSRTKLLDIVKRHDLYPDLRERASLDEIVRRMREAVTLKTMSAETRGRRGSATVAFSIAYEGDDPVTVQEVTNVLASLYLAENLKAREQQAARTTTFLQAELDQLREQIGGLESQISAFKAAHLKELPEYVEIHLQTIERAARDLEQIEAKILSLGDRKMYLQGQLDSVEPFLYAAPLPAAQEAAVAPPVNASVQRLEELRLELLVLKGTASDSHPDVLGLKRQISELEAQVGPHLDREAAAVRLAAMEQELARRRQDLGAAHPDLEALARQIAALQEELVSARAPVDQPARPSPAPAPERTPNPLHATLTTQIATTELEIAGLERDRVQLRAKIGAHQSQLENGPQVENRYRALTRDYESAKQKYGEILNKLMEARVSQGMEESQQSERFTLIDAAHRPDKPHKPNRTAIFLIGLVLALGAGVGAVALRESTDRTMKSVEEVEWFSPAPALVVFPLLKSDEERRSHVVRAAYAGVIVCVLVLVAAVPLHLFVMPLDQLWFKVLGRIARLLP